MVGLIKLICLCGVFTSRLSPPVISLNSSLCFYFRSDNLRLLSSNSDCNKNGASLPSLKVVDYSLFRMF